LFSFQLQRYYPVDIWEFSVLYDQLKMRIRLDQTNPPWMLALSGRPVKIMHGSYQ
jgi:hypothetical protein